MTDNSRNWRSTGERDWITHGLIFFGGIVVAYFLSTPGTTHAAALSRFSGFLQLFGISTAFLSLYQIRNELGLPGLLSEIREDVSKRLDALLRRPQHHVLEVGNATVTVTGFAPTVTVGLAPNATLKRRVEYLQSQVDALSAATRERERQAEADKAAATAALAELKADTDAEFQKLNAKLERISGGGMKLEIVGFTWLMIGVLLPSFSNVAYYLWPIP